ncbi:glycosyltransferase [Gloeothece verrucosa]|uniref:Glycosyl transferase group 1 n=1 Tax=Gloeothece verrucosa (strain PCC 7822) TaxID=497965 RepID=E0UKX0_GLOV7|nr:glycosyltransferase [Gloeothece verrucosa]ADN17600.1 glycosyl transferase group 1 [Gloeothece verrucosa PCC 7822]
MKILIITPYVGANYGGIAKVVQDIAIALGSQGFNIDLITTNANDAQKLDVVFNHWLDQGKYRIRYFDSWNKHDFILSLSLITWLFKNINNYDIIHTHTIFSPLILITQWLCQRKKIPYLVTPHGMLEPWALSYKSWKKNFYYNIFEKKALQKASLIQVIANLEADHVQSLGFKHYVIIPNGIDHNEFAFLSDPESFYQQFPQTRHKTLILFLGRIDPKKGLDLLAPAFARVHSQFPETHLVVAGPDNIGFLSTVERFFAEAKCLNAVTFTGMLTGKLKYAALAAASLYIAPSYSEGFSMSVLEGMASGLSCIITTGCNFPEAATAKAALIVEPMADAIADALNYCLSHPQEAKAMGNRAREFILNNYTWEKSAKKLIDVYKFLLIKNSCQNPSVNFSEKA